MNRQKKILLVLGIVFAVTLLYRIYHPFQQAEVATLTFTGKKAPAVANESKKTPGDKPQRTANMIRLDLLEAPPSGSETVKKNIFFHAAPQKTGPSKTKQTEKPKKTLVKATPTPAPPRPNPAEQVKRELSSYKIFGTYRQGNQNGVFLEKGKQIIVIHEGDKIEGKYQIKKITEKQITLYAEQLNETVHLDMSDF